MEERRRAKRFKEENEVRMNIVFPEEFDSKEKIPCHCSKDISESGIKIHGNILLPVGSIINIDIILKNFCIKR